MALLNTVHGAICTLLRTAFSCFRMERACSPWSMLKHKTLFLRTNWTLLGKMFSYFYMDQDLCLCWTQSMGQSVPCWEKCFHAFAWPRIQSLVDAWTQKRFFLEQTALYWENVFMFLHGSRFGVSAEHSRGTISTLLRKVFSCFRMDQGYSLGSMLKHKNRFF